MYDLDLNPFKPKPNLLVKDLMNDLVRESDISRRIKEQLEQSFDAVPRFTGNSRDIITTAGPVMSSGVSFAFVDW